MVHAIECGTRSSGTDSPCPLGSSAIRQENFCNPTAVSNTMSVAASLFCCDIRIAHEVDHLPTGFVALPCSRFSYCPRWYAFLPRYYHYCVVRCVLTSEKKAASSRPDVRPEESPGPPFAAGRGVRAPRTACSQPPPPP